MALEGTLHDFALPDILQLISLQKKTGLLTLRGPEDTVILGFDGGALVSAESQARRLDTRLGTLLVKTRSLAPDSLAKALEIQGQTLQRLGFILLKNGFCDADQLRAGLDAQVKKIAYGLFRWTDAEYVFDQQDRIDYDHEYVRPIQVESLLMEGARMVDEWPIIQKVVRSPELVYQRVAVGQRVEPAEGRRRHRGDRGRDRSRRRASGATGPIRISRAEWSVYELVDGRRTIGDIVERTFLSDFEGSKAFYDLLSRGLIEESRRTGVVDETGAFSVEIPSVRPAAAGGPGRRRGSSSLAAPGGIAPSVAEPRERLHDPAAARGGRGGVPEGRLPVPAPAPVGGDRRLLPDAGALPGVPGGDRHARVSWRRATSSTPGGDPTGTSSRTTPGSTTWSGSTPRGRPTRTSSSPTSLRERERRVRSTRVGKKEIIIIEVTCEKSSPR